VLNLKRLFGLEDAPPHAYAHLVILKRAPGPLAILVDRALGPAEIESDTLQPLPPGHSFNDCAEGDARIGAETVHVLSVSGLLLAEELNRIAQLQVIEEDRLRRLVEIPI
jgi:chemotaxis signal transduction protein